MDSTQNYISEKVKDTTNTYINPAIKENQEATNTKLDSQIALETALNNLITVLKDTVTTNDKTHIMLARIFWAINMAVDYDEATNARRTLSAWWSVAISSWTLTTLWNQTNIGWFSADQMTEDSSRQAWGIWIRSLYI